MYMFLRNSGRLSLFIAAETIVPAKSETESKQQKAKKKKQEATFRFAESRWFEPSIQAAMQHALH